MVGCWAGRLPPYLYENSAARAGRALILNDHAPASAADDLRTERRDNVINPSLAVWSWALMVHSSPWNGRMRYGPSSAWERPHDGGSASRDPASSREPEGVGSRDA